MGEQNPFAPGGFGGVAAPPAGAPGRPPDVTGGEVNTLATLSVVFAVVCAPVGVLLGHLALGQIRERNQAGRSRALVGVSLSYFVITLAVIMLAVWVAVRPDPNATPVATTTTTATTTTIAAAPPPQTTVITAPTEERKAVSTDELRIGDCVEVEQTEPDPNDPASSKVYIYRTVCEVRDGVMQVQQILPTNTCQTQTLFNKDRTVFACITDYQG